MRSWVARYAWSCSIRRQAVGLRVLPLAIGPVFAFGQKLGIFGLNRDFERNNAEDRVVDVMAQGTTISLGAPGHQGLKLVDQGIAQRVVMGELGEG
jgi:hypothetical protein